MVLMLSDFGENFEVVTNEEFTGVSRVVQIMDVTATSILRHRDIELDLHWNIRETKLETSFRHIPTP